MKHLTKIAPPFTPDFFGEIGLNLGLGLITSCSRKTACWDLNTVVTKVKLVRGRWWFKKLLIFRYFAVISTRLYLGGVPESVLTDVCRDAISATKDLINLHWLIYLVKAFFI